jgi:hypothetical protein
MDFLGFANFAFSRLEIPNNAMHMPAQKHCNGSLEWISWLPNSHQFPGLASDQNA